ncbi:hypothetical protein AALB53_04050 [Lachnospiraceae bacterium 47-T17]
MGTSTANSKSRLLFTALKTGQYHPQCLLQFYTDIRLPQYLQNFSLLLISFPHSTRFITISFLSQPHHTEKSNEQNLLPIAFHAARVLAEPPVNHWNHNCLLL